MEEIAEQEKELARIEAMENALDVTKQDNMGGFYRFSLYHQQLSYHDCLGRHLYRQTFGEEKGQKAPIKVEETEEQKAARVKEELKKLKVEEEAEGGEDLKVKQEEGAEQMKKVKVKRKELRKKEFEEDEESLSEESSSSDDEEGGEKEVSLSTLRFVSTYI